MATNITVSALINAPLEKAWKLWTSPEDITRWNFATEEWHAPKAENDLRKGGQFSCRMEAKDGSFGFDFGGIYDEVEPHKLIAYTMGDGRKVSVVFEGNEEETTITETFEPESTNPEDMQQAGWQAILDNFKKYAEKQ